MRTSLLMLTVLLASAGVPPAQGGEPVRFELPVKARLDVAGYRSLTVVPFLTGSEEEGAPPLPELEAELQGYLKRVLERGTRLQVDALVVDFPTFEPEALAADRAFWQAVGERAGTDLILAGAVDFDFDDRSGYVTREFVSEADGRTYLAQELVEERGVELDLLVWVLDAKSGRLLVADNLKDFRSLRGESVDPMTGLFTNLAHLEDRLLGLFATRTVRTERLLQ